MIEISIMIIGYILGILVAWSQLLQYKFEEEYWDKQYNIYWRSLFSWITVFIFASSMLYSEIKNYIGRKR